MQRKQWQSLSLIHIYFKNYRVFETEIAGRKLTVETGKMAQLANGSCLVRYGETAVLVTATAVSYTHLLTGAVGWVWVVPVVFVAVLVSAANAGTTMPLSLIHI